MIRFRSSPGSPRPPQKRVAALGVLTALVTSAAPTGADESSRIPAPGGEVILPAASDRTLYDSYHFAAARRVGNLLFVSGVIAGRRPGEGKDVDAFKAQVRRAFIRIGTTLNAAGSAFDQVVSIDTFHVWATPDFAGDKAAQFAAFGAVKDEFVRPPYPAWTAIGSSELLAPGGIVEIQVTARILGK